MDVKIYKCKKCGQIIMEIENEPCNVFCCGEPMEELIANTVDASAEKHVPVYTVEDYKVHVTVGSVEHPMTEEHHIAWMVLQTNHGIQIRELDVNKGPTMVFTICEMDKVEAVYAYCNLHGLWKA
ncbi:MAG: desulfoferrodoxin [Lachnospiraceae bacterium]|nr:desulfoferrodoxin [Lachnospiraceae bacterium]